MCATIFHVMSGRVNTGRIPERASAFLEFADRYAAGEIDVPVDPVLRSELLEGAAQAYSHMRFDIDVLVSIVGRCAEVGAFHCGVTEILDRLHSLGSVGMRCCSGDERLVVDLP